MNHPILTIALSRLLDVKSLDPGRVDTAVGAIVGTMWRSCLAMLPLAVACPEGTALGGLGSGDCARKKTSPKSHLKLWLTG